MNDSLSILVPVHNAEATVPRHIARLLEVLPELTAWFEIVVIDDASCDHTVEVVRELAAQYPQVRLIRHGQQRGREAAVRTGRQWAQGNTVDVLDDSAPVRSAHLRQLLSQRSNGKSDGARAGTCARLTAETCRADGSHSVPPRMFSSFLRHLRNLALGE